MSERKMVAAQFQGPLEQIKAKVARVLDIYYTKDIDFLLESNTKMMTFRVLVSAEDFTRAKDALYGVFEEEPHKLQIRVDSQIPLNFTKNIIKPGQTVLIGRAPNSYKLHGADAIPIEGDMQIGLTHLAVEWDGMSKLRIKDMGEGNGVVAGGVAVLPGEWMEIEPGTNVRIGQTVLRFVKM